MISADLKRWTVSNMLVLPILKLNRKHLNELGFINSFLFNGEADDELEGVIHLLFKPVKKDDFNLYADALRETGDLVDESDYYGGYTILTLKLPEEFKEDYEILWTGKYSRLSKEYKKQFPVTIKYSDRRNRPVESKTIQYMIFNRDPELREMWEEEFGMTMGQDWELWRLMEKEAETFKLSKYEKSATTVA